MKEIVAHEDIHCRNKTCANELCGLQLESLPSENLVRFYILKSDDLIQLEAEKVACSKKCKKVAKFGYKLK